MKPSRLLKTTNFSLSEIKEAVNIQVEELSEGFLSSLGKKPLMLIFGYAAASPFGILIMAKEVENGHVVGYILGTTNIDKFYKGFLHSKVLPAMLYFSPKLLNLERFKKAFETLIYPLKGSQVKASDYKAELLDMAVSRSYKGTGIGSELFKEFVNQCRLKGVKSFKIPTSQTLHGAHLFYEKMGAKKVDTIEIHKGEQTYIYIYFLK